MAGTPFVLQLSIHSGRWDGNPIQEDRYTTRKKNDDFKDIFQRRGGIQAMNESSNAGRPLSSHSGASFRCCCIGFMSVNRYVGDEQTRLSRRAFLCRVRSERSRQTVTHIARVSSSHIFMLRAQGAPKEWFSERDMTADALRSSDASSTVVL